MKERQYSFIMGMFVSIERGWSCKPIHAAAAAAVTCKSLPMAAMLLGAKSTKTCNSGGSCSSFCSLLCFSAEFWFQEDPETPCSIHCPRARVMKSTKYTAR